MDLGAAFSSPKLKDRSMKSCERGGQGDKPFTAEIDGRSGTAKQSIDW